MDNGHIFQKLWVIESLPEGDLKTGKLLVDNQLNSVKQKYPDLNIAFEQPTTKADLIKLLLRIRDEAQSMYPMLHIECHGCPDGLGVASGELVKWDELHKILIEINQACRLNLMIVLAACNGAHLIKVSNKLDRAPFWAIIGPDEEVKADDIEKDFGAFYTTFFKSLDGDAAVDALNGAIVKSERKYRFLSAAGLFMKAYSIYYKNYRIGKAKRQRIENLTTEAMQNPLGQDWGINLVRKKVKEKLAEEDDVCFEKLRNRYFFIDCYPENAKRFSLNLEDIGTVLSSKVPLS